MIEFSRRLQLLCWITYLIALPASGWWLPEMVGESSKQIARGTYIAIMLVTALPLSWVMGGGLLNWLRRHPSLLNLPHKDYWLAPERAGTAWARLDTLMLRLGWMIWSLLALIHYRAVTERQGGTAGPGEQSALPALSETTSEITLFALVILVLADVLRSTLVWRVPKAQLEAFRSQQIQDSAEAGGKRSIKRPPRPGQPSREPARGEPR